jgi:hypothetical protein
VPEIKQLKYEADHSPPSSSAMVHFILIKCTHIYIHVFRHKEALLGIVENQTSVISTSIQETTQYFASVQFRFNPFMIRFLPKQLIIPHSCHNYLHRSTGYGEKICLVEISIFCAFLT